MEFLTAKAELAKLADGEYHSMQFELTEYHNGDQATRCRVYIHEYEFSEAPTWELALDLMWNQIQQKKSKDDLEELPEIEPLNIEVKQ